MTAAHCTTGFNPNTKRIEKYDVGAIKVLAGEIDNLVGAEGQKVILL